VYEGKMSEVRCSSVEATPEPSFLLAKPEKRPR
jgi:hypothetical protein